MNALSRVLALLLLVCSLSLGTVGPGPAEAAGLPVVTKVGNGAGPLAPTRVTITGSRLTGAKAVKFGTRLGTGLRRISATRIQVTTPRGARPGTVAVRVQTRAGWSRATTKSRYVFVGVPKVSAVSPNGGSYAGGERVVVAGSTLARATAVRFGNAPARIVSRTASTVTVTAPAGVPGPATVRVTTPGGTSAVGTVRYTYQVVDGADVLDAKLRSNARTAQGVQWVTGGHDLDDPATGVAYPWTVGLSADAPVPDVGDPYYLPPGGAVYASGLAGRVSAVAAQTDGTVRLTVVPADVTDVFEGLKVGYEGPLQVDAAATARRTGEGSYGSKFAFQGPTALFCKSKDGQSVAFSADLAFELADIDVSTHFDAGTLLRKPSFDGALTAELKTTGKITVAAEATCKIKAAWQNAHRRTILLGTTGLSVSIGPSLEIKVSAKGTWSVVDRTRTTFAVRAVLGQAPQFSRATRSVESKQGGALSFGIEVTAGASVQFGILDRAGIEAKVGLGVEATVKAASGNVCVDGELYGKISIGVFLDVVIARWEGTAAEAKLKILTVHGCAAPEPEQSSTEPEITSARLPDARIGTAYDGRLETADNRNGTWSVVGGGLPAGLTLDGGSGAITGTPTGPVGDQAVAIQFVDGGGSAATSTVRIDVQPAAGLGGGDIQATLQWTGAADLDLHVYDPWGDEVYYDNDVVPSGGYLDHDANAGCNGVEDDDNAVENVYWPANEAPDGTYYVWVAVFDECAAPLDWHLVIRQNGRVVVDVTGNGASEDYLIQVGGPTGARVVQRSEIHRAVPPEKR